MCPLCMTTIAPCATGGASAAGLAALVAKVTRASDSPPRMETITQTASPQLSNHKRRDAAAQPHRLSLTG